MSRKAEAGEPEKGESQHSDVGREFHCCPVPDCKIVRGEKQHPRNAHLTSVGCNQSRDLTYTRSSGSTCGMILKLNACRTCSYSLAHRRARGIGRIGYWFSPLATRKRNEYGEPPKAIQR